MPGPAVRTDIVELYAFRRLARGAAFLQLRRAADQSLPGTWQPVMGHIHEHEPAADAALRELDEETAFSPGQGLLALWQLEQPSVYYLHPGDTMMLSPCFAAEIEPDRAPTLSPAHDAARWVSRDRADRAFLWPGQRAAIGQIVRDILEPGSPAEPILRIPLADRPPQA